MCTTKPWNEKAWKQRRKEILKIRDKCEWCGLTQEESLQKYGKGLVIDHISYGPSALRQWLMVAWELYGKQTGVKPRGNRPIIIGAREPKAFKEFKKSHKAKIDKEYSKRKEDPFERYKELEEEDIQVLCARCNLQRTKGYVLCSKCKQKYHMRRYDACYECNKEKIEERRREREQGDRYFRALEAHDRDFMYGVNHPEICHLRWWYCEECGVPIDFEHFCNYARCGACFMRLAGKRQL